MSNYNQHKINKTYISYLTWLPITMNKNDCKSSHNVLALLLSTYCNRAV